MTHTLDTSTMAEPEYRSPHEFILLGLVALTAVIANLPGSLLEPLGVRPGYLLALLGLIVVLALFLYLRVFFFLLYVLLAIGANVPAQWADALGISQMALLITLVAMVALSLLNYGVKLLPSGIESTSAPEHKPSAEGTKALLIAIERGNAMQVRQILAMEIDPDQPGGNGITPLMLAAQLGHADMVDALLAAGADMRLTNADGRNAHDMALRKGHAAIVKKLTPPSDQTDQT